MTQQKKKPYFKSRVFTQLFLSYVILIVAFLLIYIGWYVYSYREVSESHMRDQYQQLTDSWGITMDQQFLAAQGLCSSINTSENCRNVLQTAYVEKKTIDSMQLYKLLNEMTRIKSSANNINVYSLMLGFLGDMKLYTPRNVISISDAISSLKDYPQIRYSSVSDLLGISCGGDMALNKKFLIYADRYSGFGSASSDRGIILVLLEQNRLQSMAEKVLPEAIGISIRRGNEEVFAAGNPNGVTFTVPSLIDSQLFYCVCFPLSVLKPHFPVSAMFPLFALVLIGALFMLATFHISKRYYQRIDSINQMIEPEPDTNNEFDHILHGIRSLIGERNGYREKMVTISPYAQKGMLHSLISGNIHHQQLQVLINEQFEELSKPCFMLGLVNLAYETDQEVIQAKYKDACELISNLCREMSTDEMSIVTVGRDLQNLYVIASGDSASVLEDLFYQLHSAIDELLGDPAMAVTIGISRCEQDLERLPNACRDAEQALGHMIAGGRRCVYFFVAPDQQEQRRYFFPKDAQKRMIRDLRERNMDDLHALLNELLTQNILQADLSPVELDLMVDELHVTVRSAISEAMDMSTTRFEVSRVPMPATMEEILGYYAHVFEMILEKPDISVTVQEDAALDQSVCDYINANLYNPDLSQNSVSDQFNLSSKTIGMICKKHFGTTFLQYVRECQIRHAVELLESSGLSLEQIAQECGFTNLLTFRRNFKAVMNMNPSDFRK